MRVYLLGMMGAGKSRVGALLAEQWQIPFLDLDEAIESKTGKAISTIFQEDGEPAFRRLESEALQETEATESMVVACGGGTPCHGNNMDWILAHGLSIFLEVSTNELLRRLHGQISHRPLLANLPDRASRLQKLQELYATRLPCYQRAALTVLAEGKPEEVATHIHHHWLSIIGH